MSPADKEARRVLPNFLSVHHGPQRVVRGARRPAHTVLRAPDLRYTARAKVAVVIEEAEVRELVAIFERPGS